MRFSVGVSTRASLSTGEAVFREREGGELGGDAPLRFSSSGLELRLGLEAGAGGLIKASLCIREAGSREREGGELGGYSSLRLSRRGLEHGDSYMLKSSWSCWDNVGGGKRSEGASLMAGLLAGMLGEAPHTYGT